MSKPKVVRILTRNDKGALSIQEHKITETVERDGMPFVVINGKNVAKVETKFLVHFETGTAIGEIREDQTVEFMLDKVFESGKPEPKNVRINDPNVWKNFVRISKDFDETHEDRREAYQLLATILLTNREN